MGAGVYYVRDTKFGSMFPNYELCKIGYTHNLKRRLIQFPNYDDLEIVKFQSFGGGATLTMYELEQKWIGEQRIWFQPFWNTKTLNSKAIERMELPMREYFQSMIQKHHIVDNLTSNWGSTEWFVIKK